MVREYSERLLELHPESTVALEGLAAWACAAGDHALTAKFCTLLVSAVPAHFEGLVQSGAGAPEIGPLGAGGTRLTKKRIKLRPRSSEALDQPGNRARAAGRRSRRAGGIRPGDAADNPEALAPIWNMALLLEHSGQLEEAERWYKTVLEKAPKEEEARFRLGYLRLQREEFRGAAEAFEGCLKYRPQWPEA